ncbi:hypothetical protein AGR1C_Cc11132 [Agrobacterium fabacearum TT111]|nr:hypothetical protein AGR1C_Cc11132 [Agrobacterium fabacearum TT111]
MSYQRRNLSFIRRPISPSQDSSEITFFVYILVTYAIQ